MKKLLSVLLVVLFVFAAGCSNLQTKTATLDNEIEIPQNGIISADTLDRIKTENKVTVFYGKSDETEYKWTVFGSSIKETKDINLKVDFYEVSEKEISFKVCNNGGFGFSPALAIYLNDKLTIETAVLYSKDGENETKLSEIQVSSKDNSVLNFSLSTGGEYVIRFSSQDNTDTADSDSDNDYKTAPSGDTDGKEPTGGDQSQKAESTDKKATESKAPTDKNKGNTASAGKPKPGDKEVSNGNTSSGNSAEKDKYLTDPIPEGKPKPVEPEDQEVDKDNTLTCTFLIECTTILNNLADLDTDKLEAVPPNGIILEKTTVVFYEGESVFDLLQRICKENKIHLEASWTPIYNSAYVEGIANLYEFDCGALSGWMYRVNGWYPNYGCSRYQLKPGDVVEFRYTCDLGWDIGGGYAIGD